MKQIIQNIRSGQLSVTTVPEPAVIAGHVLIANQASLVSAGTEKMIMDLAKKSLLGKARERPDHVRRVLEKIRSEGLFSTLQQVKRKLDEPVTMGYSSAGIVLACGAGVENFKPGDRVASNGPHAEIVSVPKNLCAKIPVSVNFEDASFAVLGSIALHGLRLGQCELGESVFVIGLGLVGQLAVALAKSAGLNVIGTDPDADRCQLALQMGADFARPNLSAGEVNQLAHEHGVDAVLITASTKSNAPMEAAAGAVRKRGRIVLVGVVGLELDRRPFYFKEAEFVVSCSYGPGRYDSLYEDDGIDYPYSYVRWTEQRNIQAVLDLMGRKRLDVSTLITHRFPIDSATQAYDMISEGTEKSLGVIIQYPEISPKAVASRALVRSIALRRDPPKQTPSDLIRIGVFGAGNFAKMVMLPAIQKAKAFAMVSICSGKGLTAMHAGMQNDFEKCCTDEDTIFQDPTIEAVFSLTRHDQHAKQVIAAIRAGKHIFVEKPLCLTTQELSEIEQAIADSPNPPLVTVGFNRRFSPAARKLKEFFESVTAPLTVSIRFNAGDLPADHWTQHAVLGGGRIVGESCHAIDLATFLVGSPPIRVYAESIGDTEPHQISDDQCFITIRHSNGSISNIGYLAGGDKAFPKERIEVIGGGKVGVIDDFRSVTTCARGKIQTVKMTSNKGHEQEVAAWAQAIRTDIPPIPWAELSAVTLCSILAVQSLREGVAFDF